LNPGELFVSESSTEHVFTFDAIAPRQSATDEVAPDPVEAKRLADTLAALRAADQAAYQWNIETDEIIWTENISDILGCPANAVSTAKRFAALLDQDNLSSRYDMVMNSQASDRGDGVLFELEYLFRPAGRKSAESVWVEDIGRWYANQDGRPSRVMGVVRRIDEKHQRDQRLSFLGNHDPLTGLMNRGRLGEALEETILMTQREGTKCSLAIVSINNLHVVNESYGFDVADEVIVAIGRRLKQVMRTGDGLSRYSGSKFGIIFNNCAEEELPVAIERLMSTVRDSVVETTHGPVWVMLSIGAVTIPIHADSANSAMTRAEVALTEASVMPSDSYVIFKPSKSKASEQLLNSRCATEIVRCLKTDGFRLAFQPIYNSKTGQVEHHEALLRMIDENGDVVAAGHLVPIAERLGLIRLIDRAVTQMAIATLHSYPEANLAINISGTTATDRRWYKELLDTIRANGDVAHRLTVEITETVALSDLDATRELVEQLHVAGCSVAIDDFGAGYTSFKNLRDLPVEVIKIDGTFCRNLAVSKENLYFVKSLVDLVHAFGRKVVAEWVATEEDAKLLASIGVDFLQGNYLGAANLTPPWKNADTAEFEIAPQQSPSNTPMEIHTLTVDRHEDEFIKAMERDPPTSAVKNEIVAGTYPEVIARAESAGILALASDLEALAEASQIDLGAIMPKPVEAVVASHVDAGDDDVAKLRETLDLLNSVFRKPKALPASDTFDLQEAV
jgi:diguanylate cyclase (GGDEF)-like protein